MTVSKITSPVTPLEEVAKINEIIDNLGGGGGGGGDNSSSNIGEIVTSTIPLSDAGLHLLDGGVISGIGTYSAFVTYIAGLVSGHSELFATESDWQTSVTNYGVCGKFVYDSQNNTVRLPKLYSNERYLIKSYSSGTDWYRIYSDGWCEQGGHYTHDNVTVNVTTNLIKAYKDTNYDLQITKELGSSPASTCDYQYTSSYVMSSKTVSSFQTKMTTNNRLNGYDWQASGYIDISDLEIATQYNYIVIATSTKTQIEVDIDEVMTDLNGKADVDLSNCTKPHIVETWHSGTEWYRVWSDGWCEQGGTLPAISISAGATASQTLTFHKQMADTDYTVLFGALSGAFPTCYLTDRTVNGGTAKPANRAGSGSYSTQFCWEVKGYCVV